MYQYHPGFPSSLSPVVCAMSHRHPRCTCPPHSHRPAPSLQTFTHTSPGPYAWYGGSAIGNAPDANYSTNMYRYIRSVSGAALAPPTLTAAPFPRNNTIHNVVLREQHIYTTQKFEAHLKTPNSPCPACLCCRATSMQWESRQTIGLDRVINYSGGFRTRKPLEKPHTHARIQRQE